MAMRRKIDRMLGQTSTAGAAASGFDHHPFRSLAKLLSTNAARPPAAPTPAPPPLAVSSAANPDCTDDELFRREMADVRPMPDGWRARIPEPPPSANGRPISPIAADDAEVLAELSELVTGQGSFDISHSTEFIEGAVVGLDRRLVRRLRDGEFAYQSHLDLHGMTAQEARSAVDRFLTEAHRKGYRCVLIVHGRGLNSKDQVPVLKNRLSTWLARGAWSRLVLAFTSARSCDGGAGALYVLLRRDRKAKRPILVTRGARW